MLTFSRARRELEMDSTSLPALEFGGMALGQLGRSAEALTLLRRKAELEPTASAIALLGIEFARAGDRQGADSILEDLRWRERRGYVFPLPIAAIHANLGEADSAFAWLERAYRERSAGIADLGMITNLDPIRQDPRFAALIRRVGLPQRGGPD